MQARGLRFSLLLPIIMVTLSGCGASDDRREPENQGRGGSSAGGSGGTNPSGGSSGSASGAAGVSGSAGDGASAGDGGSAGNGGPAAGDIVIAATARGTCALDASGEIACWGLARLAPGGWQIPAGSFVSLVSSSDVVCAIRADRSFTCFPEPIGTADLSYVPNRTVRELALGRGAVCGTDEEARPFCAWSAPQFDLTVPEGERFRAISVGTQFACGLRESDASILCWGSPGTEGCVWAPISGQLDAPGGEFIGLSSHQFASCALDAGGTIQCWGAGDAMDDPAAEHCDSRINFGQSVPPDETFRSVVVGANHSCGVREDGSVACWGAGTDAASDCPDGFECGQSLTPSGAFMQVAVGGLHTCAMREDRTVSCWGWDGDGDGRTTPPQAFQ